MTIPYGTWTPACLQLCASIVRIQVFYGDNMSKSNIRKITADPTKCNIDSSRRPSVFERLGTKPAIATTAAQNTSDYCRNWALNGSCSYGKNCKWVPFARSLRKFPSITPTIGMYTLRDFSTTLFLRLRKRKNYVCTTCSFTRARLVQCGEKLRTKRWRVQTYQFSFAVKYFFQNISDCTRLSLFACFTRLTMWCNDVRFTRLNEDLMRDIVFDEIR